jgi:hypothetical protein
MSGNFTARKDWRSGYEAGHAALAIAALEHSPTPRRYNPYTRPSNAEAWELGFDAGHADSKKERAGFRPRSLSTQIFKELE